MEHLIGLLEISPVLSIVLIFVLIIFLSWLFKDTIVEVLKKKFGLYDANEIKQAYIDARYSTVKSQLGMTKEDRKGGIPDGDTIISQLKENRLKESRLK